MIWLPFLALALAAFVVAVTALRLPRAAYTLMGATLLFGLAGYALQGSPGAPTAPAQPSVEAATTGELLVSARRDLFDPEVLPSRFLITSDGFARRGDYVRAAAFARHAADENPADGEAWTALGIALIEHAGGQVTPAASFAFTRAQRAAPLSPAPGYFFGLALLRAGQPDRARAIWAELLAAAPADARWKPILADRLARLDALLASMPPPAPS